MFKRKQCKQCGWKLSIFNATGFCDESCFIQNQKIKREQEGSECVWYENG